MILQNIHIIGETVPRCIKIINKSIGQIVSNEKYIGERKNELLIEFNNAMAFPGLINSHDHLEFNLFPKLGNRIYKNYLEWGKDIHNENKTTINEINRIPKVLRAEWGFYKNLLNGITTVVQHGERFQLNNPAINIFQNCYCLHSVGTEKYWALKLNRPFRQPWPFVIHTGEGTDDIALKEIDQLIKWNFLKKKLVGIHGVSMSTKQAKAFEALVWCPGSNFFLLNATSKINELKQHTRILFGTDATVSSSWNLWEHIRLARKLNMLSDQELLNSLSLTPAEIWKLKNKGAIAVGNDADIVIAKMKDKNNALNSFMLIDPEDILLILVNGEISLFDEDLKNQMEIGIGRNKFDKIFINKVGKYVKGNLGELAHKIKEHNPTIKFPIEFE